METLGTEVNLRASRTVGRMSPSRYCQACFVVYNTSGGQEEIIVRIPEVIFTKKNYED